MKYVRSGPASSTKPDFPGVCVVGSGAIAKDHASALKESDLGTLEWVVSRRAEAADAFAQAWNFKNASTSLAAALRDPAVDVVVIASPNSVHAAQAEACLLAGKDVLVEIPVGLTLSSVQGLSKMATELGRRVFACHTMRSFSAISHLRCLVMDGEFEISQVVGTFAIPRRHNQGWSGQRSWVDDLLWHHACHLVDTTFWVLGRDSYSNVNALTGNRHPEYGMYMDLAVSFECVGNQPAVHSLSYNSEELIWELRFFGTNCTFVFRNGELFQDGKTQVVAASDIRDLRSQDEEIFDSLGSGKESNYDLGTTIGSYSLLQEVDDNTGWRND